MIHQHYSIDIGYNDDKDCIEWSEITLSGKPLAECSDEDRELLQKGLEHYFNKDRKSMYFVSYAFQTNNRSGFGSCMIGVCGRVSEIDDITYLQDAILKNNSNLKDVVILNYKLVE